ncbi:hypothetical protein ONZ45_g15783 [Pleurotus djamor]|nr:hypothetical protein ONZ45_g15783 [Pleurotus djamor]
MPQLSALGPQLAALFETTTVKVTFPRKLTGEISIADPSALRQGERVLLNAVDDALCGLCFRRKLRSSRELVAQKNEHFYGRTSEQMLYYWASNLFTTVGPVKLSDGCYIWSFPMSAASTMRISIALSTPAFQVDRQHEPTCDLTDLVRTPPSRRSTGSVTTIGFLFLSEDKMIRIRSFVSHLMGLDAGFCSEVAPVTLTGQKRSRSPPSPTSSFSKVQKSTKSVADLAPSTCSLDHMVRNDTLPRVPSTTATPLLPSCLRTSGLIQNAGPGAVECPVTDPSPSTELHQPMVLNHTALLAQATPPTDVPSLPSLHGTTNLFQNTGSEALVPSMFDFQSLRSKMKSAFQGLKPSPSAGLLGSSDMALQAHKQPLLPTFAATTGVLGSSNSVLRDPHKQPRSSTARATSARPSTLEGGAPSAPASSSPLDVRQPAAASSLKRGRDAAHLDPVTRGDHRTSKRRNVRRTP